MNKEIIEIDINSIAVKHRIRLDNGNLTSLENSIHNVGLLHPVIIDKDNVLVSGSRRLQAARNAGLKTVPAIKLDIQFDSMIALDIQSDENLCRERLTPEELERHIQRKKTIFEKGSTSDGGLVGWFKKLFNKG